MTANRALAQLTEEELVEWLGTSRRVSRCALPCTPAHGLLCTNPPRRAGVCQVAASMQVTAHSVSTTHPGRYTPAAARSDATCRCSSPPGRSQSWPPGNNAAALAKPAISSLLHLAGATAAEEPSATPGQARPKARQPDSHYRATLETRLRCGDRRSTPSPVHPRHDVQPWPPPGRPRAHVRRRELRG